MKPDVLILLMALLPVCAGAQVVVHQAALDQLAGVMPVAAAPAVPVVRVHKIHHHARVIVAVAPVRPKPAAVVPVVVAPAGKLTVVKPRVRPPVAQLRFASGSAALLPGASSLLKPFCGVGGMVSIAAAAPAGDPSAAMRLGLDRAFAVRDALTACGVPAAHILPRVLAAGPGGGADTAQLTVVP